MTPKCFVHGCDKRTTNKTFWGPIGNRYEVYACTECAKTMAESDRAWAGIQRGFAEYNAYYDAKGK